MYRTLKPSQILLATLVILGVGVGLTLNGNQRLQAQGENTRIYLQPSTTTIQVGDVVDLQLRCEATGNSSALFSCFTNMSFTPGLVSIESITYSASFPNYRQGVINTDQITNLGAVATVAQPGNSLVATVRIRAVTAGNLTVSLDSVAGNDFAEVTAYGLDNDQRDTNNARFENLNLTINGNGGGQPGDVDASTVYDFVNPGNIEGIIRDGNILLNRSNATPAAGFFFDATQDFSAGDKYRFSLRMGNTYTETKLVRFTVRKAQNDATDLVLCGFNVTTNTSDVLFTIEGTIPTSWIDTPGGTVRPTVFISPNDFDGEEYLVINESSMNFQKLDPGAFVEPDPCRRPQIQTDRNLVLNPSFTHGESFLKVASNMRRTYPGGVLNATRASEFDKLGAIDFDTRAQAQPGMPLYLQVDIGNSSNVAKSVHLLVRSQDNIQIRRCVFTVPANTPLRTYTMETKATRFWNGISARAAFDDFNTDSVLIDNYRIEYQPALNAPDGVATCVPPTTVEENKNLLVNGDFTQPINGSFGPNDEIWDFAGAGAGASSIAGGAARLVTTDLNNKTRVTQEIRFNMPTTGYLELRTRFNNSAAAPQNVTVVMFNASGGLPACFFSIPANASNYEHVMRWPLTGGFNGYPLVYIQADSANLPFLQVDNAVAIYNSTPSVNALECVSASSTSIDGEEVQPALAEAVIAEEAVSEVMVTEEAVVTEDVIVEVVATEEAVVEVLATEEVVVVEPEAPATEEVIAVAPVTEPPATEEVIVVVPVTEAPATEEVIEVAPVTEPPATEEVIVEVVATEEAVEVAPEVTEETEVAPAEPAAPAEGEEAPAPVEAAPAEGEEAPAPAEPAAPIEAEAEEAPAPAATEEAVE